jgi:hypothetical protein
MTTDNRANEPTEAQVEAAAKALKKHRHVVVAPGPHRCSCGYVLDGWAAAHKLHAARAILEAAQEAAPQAESEHQHEWDSETTPPRMTCQCASPLPSSGVDEDKLAEVIRKLRFNDEGCRDDGIDCTESVSDHADEIARAVAAWLKGQER